jgi:hypothetical protein
MTLVTVVSLLAIVGLAVVHLFSGELRFLDVVRSSTRLSIVGGISVAYLLVHLLPELSDGREIIAETLGEDLAFLERRVYPVTLLGS